MTHKKILNLIENVDVNDAEQLNEIDARVQCYIKKLKYVGKIVFEPHIEKFPNSLSFSHIVELKHNRMKEYDVFEFNTSDRKVYYPSLEPYTHSWKHSNIYAEPYTRSRDASQAIGKKSVYIWVRRVAFGSVEYFYPEHELYGSMIIAGWDKAKCATESLAYLHGKIQAIAHERGNL